MLSVLLSFLEATLAVEKVTIWISSSSVAGCRLPWYCAVCEWHKTTYKTDLPSLDEGGEISHGGDRG